MVDVLEFRTKGILSENIKDDFGTTVRKCLANWKFDQKEGPENEMRTCLTDAMTKYDKQIGIIGGSCSGKSSFRRDLLQITEKDFGNRFIDEKNDELAFVQLTEGRELPSKKFMAPTFPIKGSFPFKEVLNYLDFMIILQRPTNEHDKCLVCERNSDIETAQEERRNSQNTIDELLKLINSKSISHIRISPLLK